ncbi:hypothetical protein MAR_010246 [Mya arenaria]|uniref:Secreted protein n=1 Tax=Mya arenaria TaxID=6604 RepID=A0ABY7E101_MYAAR|nr:hypothetical protein MAR_010246 [Mya arenaria]
MTTLRFKSTMCITHFYTVCLFLLLLLAGLEVTKVLLVACFYDLVVKQRRPSITPGKRLSTTTNQRTDIADGQI